MGAVPSRVLTTLLMCPSCRSELASAECRLKCLSCGRWYPLKAGVPDLRPDSDLRDPPRSGLFRRSAHALVSRPAVYDLVQRVAGRERVFARLGDLLVAPDGAVVLDVGAGTGRIEALLPITAQYIWLDRDARKLARFRKRSAAPAVIGDATKIPIRDGAADWTLCIGLSHHVDARGLPQMLDELRRITKARLVFLDAVASDSPSNRLLWRYDRGAYPRAAEVLLEELASRFTILKEDLFDVWHRYLLVTAA